MGNDCSPDDRVFRYELFHQSIYAIENDIKKELFNQDLSDKKYMPFGLINQGLCKKYKFLLNKNFDKNEAGNKILNYNDLKKKNEDKDFTYLVPKLTFYFPSDFIFINKDIMETIRDNVPEKYKSFLETKFDIIIGGECLVMKNPNDKKDENPCRYIILYNEIKENIGNEIDFFLYIKDKKERNNAVNYILKNNLSNYFDHIKYNYKDEYKKIYEGNKDIGYIARNSEASRYEKYINKLKERKQHISQNNLNFQNPQQNEANIFNVSNQQLNLQNPMNIQIQQNIQNSGNNPMLQQNITNIPNTSKQAQNLQNFRNNINQQINFVNIPIFSNQQQNLLNLGNLQSQQNNFANNPLLSNQQQNLLNFGNFPSQQQNPIDLKNLPQSGNNKQKRVERYITSKPQISNVGMKSDFLLTPAIEYLFLIDELNKNSDFQSFMEKIKTSAGPKIKKALNYKIIFELILTGLDPKVQANKEYYNQSEQYDEEKAHKKFMDRHNSEKDSNIIQKLFLIPKEDAIFCKKCKMNSYQFGYEKYIYINNPQSDLLNQILFIPQKEVIKGKSCNFCNGETTECSIEKKILGFPQKLIVIIEYNQINNFVLLQNLVVQYNNQIIYKLNKFIEANTNILYKIDEMNTIFCEKFINDRFTEPEKLGNKQPIVLFYDLMSNYININPQDIIKNQQNMNNANPISQNNNIVFKAINQQNWQQIQNPQNIISQNNDQNLNQINNNQMNFQQNENQQNMNNQMNFQQNFNPQLLNQNNMQLINPQGFNQQHNFQNFNGQNQINNINNINNFQNIMDNNNQMNMNMNNIPMQVQFNKMNNNNMQMMNNRNNNNMNVQNPYEEIQYLKNKITTLENKNKLLEEENKELKLKIENLNNNQPKLVDFNQIRVIQFISDDHSLICGINCLPSDTFAEVEEKLYKMYPEYRETNNVFQVDGRGILRFKTIAENNIQPGHFVKIQKIEY